MRRPERILILHDYGGARGGAELVALDFRRLLRARGMEARLLASDADAWDATSSPDATCRGGRGRLQPLREIYNGSAAAALKRELREFRPDIVQIVMFLTQLSPAILPPLADIPTVYSADTYRAVCPTGLRWRPEAGICTLTAGPACHGKGCLSEAGLPFRRAQLALLERWRTSIDRIVAPSFAMAEILARHGWQVSEVIPHGVPAHVRASPMGDQPVAAYSGRLVPEKGVEWLIRSFARVTARLPAASLSIVGDGPARTDLERLARTLGISDRITFTGHLPRRESQAILERAWVQVVPSLWAEPFGLVAAEALMRGTPVIASDAGGPREIVDHGVTGWVVPASDEAAMADALVAGLSDVALCQRFGEAGRQAARARHDENEWISRYLAIYGDLLDRGRSG